MTEYFIMIEVIPHYFDRRDCRFNLNIIPNNENYYSEKAIRIGFLT